MFFTKSQLCESKAKEQLAARMRFNSIFTQGLAASGIIAAIAAQEVPELPKHIGCQGCDRLIEHNVVRTQC